MVPILDRTWLKFKVLGVTLSPSKTSRLFEALILCHLRKGLWNPESERHAPLCSLYDRLSFKIWAPYSLEGIVLQPLCHHKMASCGRNTDVESSFLSRLDMASISTFVKNTIGSSDRLTGRITVERLSALTSLVPWAGSSRVV